MEMQLAMQHGPVLPRHDQLLLESVNYDEALYCELPGVAFHFTEVANAGIICESDPLMAPAAQAEDFFPQS